MKKLIRYTNILIGIALLFCGCSEDIFTPSDMEGENVIMSLSYSDVSPREVVVNTRAKATEENRLNNLYIYIFNANGHLKGFKAIENAEELDQTTSTTDRSKLPINGIKTKVGASYIYAVANIDTGLYPVETSNGEVESGKLPIGLDENKAQAGEYDFTLEQLKALNFKRNNPETIQISSAFLMTGAVKNGSQVNIKTVNGNGVIDGSDNDIKLSRIVSKVRFTIKAKDQTADDKKNGVTSRKFKLSTYDIMNISMDGKLISKADDNQVNAPSSSDFSNLTGQTISVNNIDENGAEYFECYLPENLENRQHDVTEWDMREDDSQTQDKIFTNAPSKGTYIVLKGKYEEEKNGITRTADVAYYVHLGDCSVDANNYDVERNCKYTFNVKVAGVDKIIVEAKKEGNAQPGSEGVVMEYGSAGKTLILDSHYDYMVMRFFQKDIKELRNENKGYYYQVYALGKNTNPINVGASITEKDENDKAVDTSWIEFAISSKDGKSKSSYDAKGKGTPCDYPGKGKTDDIETFLTKLYNHAYDTDNKFWANGSGNDRYVDATCFVSENYYPNMTWNQYVNDVPKRAFYVANSVRVSNDKRSVYATTQYGLQQYNIQTFYDRDRAGSIIAYGCETINDEEGKGFTDSGGTSQHESYGTSKWDGRSNMLKDIFTIEGSGKQKTYSPKETWEKLKGNKSLVKACMSRNRDLNGDGKITPDEVRWYAPALDQYIGLWIGEEIISTESKLFNKSTSILNNVGNSQEPAAGTRMLYYTSTKGTNTYFSEEGLATINHSNKYPATYVRCVRNLQSNGEGHDNETSPDTYYSHDKENRLIKLDKVDTQALNITGEQGELNEHTERSEGNKPASAFYYAKAPYSNNFTQQQVVEGTAKCYGKYNENGKTWRVPNQREMSMMFLVDKNLVQQTYCRTKFSNMNFRKSWTYDNGVFTMDVAKWTVTGSIRCVKGIGTK